MQKRPDSSAAEDAFADLLLGGRYRIVAVCEKDHLGSFYKGIDEETQQPIGVRITMDADTHRRLHEWLGQAILSRGKDAILAVGHIDAGHSYVVHSEAALNVIKPKPVDEEDEGHRS